MIASGKLTFDERDVLHRVDTGVLTASGDKHFLLKIFTNITGKMLRVVACVPDFGKENTCSWIKLLASTFLVAS